MEAFILYIYICYGAHCQERQWQANGVFQRSHEYSQELVRGYPSKEPLHSAEKMCERAAADLQLRKGYWKCVNSGFHR